MFVTSFSRASTPQNTLQVQKTFALLADALEDIWEQCTRVNVHKRTPTVNSAGVSERVGSKPSIFAFQIPDQTGNHHHSGAIV